MNYMITRCPSCATSFRITDNQLKTAKGAVRCGSCLHIFKALDNLAPTKDQPETKALPEKGSPKPEAATEIPTKFEYKRPGPIKHQPTEASPENNLSAEEPEVEPSSPDRPLAREPDNTEAQKFVIQEAHESELLEPAPPEQGPSPIAEDETLEEEIPLPSVEFEENPDDLPASTSHADSDNNSNNDRPQKNRLAFDQNAIDNTTGISELDEDDMLISDDMSLGGEEETPKTTGTQAYGDDLNESFLDLDPESWKPQEKSLFDREAKPEEEEDKDNSDESWAVNLLEEMEDDDSSDGFIQPPPPEDENSDEPTIDYSRSTTGTFSALDDDDIEEALGAPLSERLSEDDQSSDAVVYKDRDDSFDNDQYSEEKTDTDQYQPLSNDSYEYEEDDYSYEESEYQEDDYAESENRSALLRRIQPEPLEMESRGYIHWRKKLIYTATVSVGLLLLLIQVAWLQYDTLSRDQSYRGWYSFFGIEVPNLNDKERIRAYNLIVRSHPDTSDALMVDTILLNTAPFNQPFPKLVLSFSNIQGDVLAARTFAPTEYLAGELAGKTQMPSGQPVHLSLEIVDPGPDAVNYTAYIP